MKRQNRLHIKNVVSCITAAALAFQITLPGTAIAEETSDITVLSGSETENDIQRERITISGAEDLEALAQRCRVDSASKNLEVVLTEDISLAGRSFTPIPFFSGVFDGQGHTIRGISLRSDGSCLGLFRHVGEGALVRDLNVEGSEVNLAPIIQSLSGLYIINSENPKINSQIKADAEKFINGGEYELLMEAKDNGETVRMYTVGTEKVVNSFVMLSLDGNEINFICVDGKMNRDDLDKLLADAMK